ncbi:MAG: hypothetical protein V4517_20050 [Pseudomonadota bacterium]
MALSIDSSANQQTDGSAQGPTAQIDSITTQPPRFIEQQRAYFLIGGMLFLAAGFFMYLLAGYIVFKINEQGPIITVPTDSWVEPSKLSEKLSERDVYNFYGRILSFAFAPVMCIISATICTLVGIRLLRAVGIATTQVITPQDFPILAPAIAAGNEQSITQFIRLSSLTGVTGTFTKIGLTGLPLATIFLTIVLAIGGLARRMG